MRAWFGVDKDFGGKSRAALRAQGKLYPAEITGTVVGKDGLEYGLRYADGDIEKNVLHANIHSWIPPRISPVDTAAGDATTA